MKTVRCAIYTRKSSDEGLEQSFNSLDAQREACSAYILSQASEGWTEVPGHYDDGGLSGGTLERPALQRLLGDVREGTIDIIVVYKVDRLTRSLFDFAKLVDLLDAGGTSFVSVTQSFNTTTSMGRLTLNMLLSFAQFEREVTAERIRDKIAASKAKGMWMGGNPPVGYAPDGRTLKVVESEAAQVRDIFQRYLKVGNVRQVADALLRERILTPPRVNGKGKAYGGCAWSRGQIYKLLSNPVYIGLIEHKETRYPGLHPPIIDNDTWEYAQAKLAENLQGRRTGTYARDTSLLSGRVVDATAAPLTAEHACKGTTRYRYYVTRRGDGAELRVPARELEAAVVEQIGTAFQDQLTLADQAALTLSTNDLLAINEQAQRAAGQIAARDRALIRELVQRVTLSADGFEIECDTAVIARLLGISSEPAKPTLTLSSAARISRTGRVVKLVDAGGTPLVASADGSLLRLIVKAHRWWDELRKGEIDISGLAAREGVQSSYLTRVLRLAFLSPRVTEGVIRGRQSAAASVSELTLGTGVPPSWSEQETVLIAPAA